MLILGVSSFADEFKDTEGKYLDMMRAGKPIVRYMYELDRSTEEKAHDTYKVFCHVMDPDGTDTITKGPGFLYTHHRGIYIGWMSVGYAKEGQKNMHSDLWHMKDNAVQKHIKFSKQESDANKSVLASQIDWIMSDGTTKCMEEVRTFTVHKDDDAHLLLDFESVLKAVGGDVVLKGDSEHAGFQYRAHQDVADNKGVKGTKFILPEEGIKVKEVRDLPWAAATYELRGNWYNVQMMNHPDNPKDSQCSAYRGYGRFGFFPSASIKNGETLTLKYRIRITTGDNRDMASREVLAEQYNKYIK